MPGPFVRRDTEPSSSEVTASGSSSGASHRGCVLRDVDFLAPPGQLTCVFGEVGSGKSSLLLAILGELVKDDGVVVADGTIAYVSQTPYIMNATVKENVLFGRPFDPVRYQTALTVSCLLPDIAIMPARDDTEIGERGINLSGGQRCRVSLARAVYRDADIYLLDDPLR